MQDPVAQLEQLARRQSDVLASKLSLESASTREIPSRNLPYGSDGVVSPTYVAQGPSTGEPTGSDATSRTVKIEKPSYQGPGAMWEKDETFPVTEQEISPSGEERDVPETRGT